MSIYGDGKHIFTRTLEGFAKKNKVLQDKLSKNGTDAMLGSINMANNCVNNVSNPSANTDAATKAYVDSNAVTRLAKSGDTMLGALAMSSNKISGLGDPISLQDCSTKSHVDALGMPSFIIITGIIPNAPKSEIYLYTAPSNRTLNSGKLWAIKLWMERVSSAGEWFISSAPGFKSLRANVCLYIRDNTLMCNFTGVPYNINSWSRRCKIHIFQFP